MQVDLIFVMYVIFLLPILCIEINFSSNAVVGNHWIHELKNAIWATYDMNSLPNSTQHQPKVNPFSIIHEQFKDGKVHRYKDRKKRSIANEDQVRLIYLCSSKCEWLKSKCLAIKIKNFLFWFRKSQNINVPSMNLSKKLLRNMQMILTKYHWS